MTKISLNANCPIISFAFDLNRLPSFQSFQSVVDRVFKNPFFWALNLTGGGIATIAAAITILPSVQALATTVLVLSILGVTLQIQSDQTKKWLFCELSLLGNVLFSSPISAFLKRPWFSQINDQLTLGASPLKHQVETLKEQGHTAVLSMIESFETEPHLFGIPAKPADWRAAGVHFLNLPNPDLTPVRDEDVDKGVEYLNQQISQGRKVYVHCQAGVGRSATIVICYLIKYQRMSLQEAVAFVSSKRAIAVNENSIAIRRWIERHSNASSV
jgi:protein-tyrosine phosphatase